MTNKFFKTRKNIFIPVIFALTLVGCQTSVTTTVGTSPTPSSSISSTISPTPVATPTASETPMTGTRTESFQVSANSTIKDGVGSQGNNYVFKYSQSVDPIPMAVDDEYADIIMFEITPQEKDNFTYQDADLAKINAYTVHSCFCPPETTSPKPLLKGKITGTKIGDQTWKIESTNDIANFSGEFKVKSVPTLQ